MCFQEEESPCGEVALKRDRSFSEHDLAQLRSEMASGLQSAAQPPGGTEPPRARAGSMHSWRPSSRDQGKYRLYQCLLLSRSLHGLCVAAWVSRLL
jgi:hypothetical protein